MKLEEISPSKIAPLRRLTELQHQRVLSQIKWLVIVGAVAVLSLIGMVVFSAKNEWLDNLYFVICIATVFLVGAWLFLKTPVLPEVEREYSQVILPGLFAQMGATEVRAAKYHDLSMKTFLEAGLFHDKYSTISREDSVQGKIDGRLFGMYEVAMQTVATYFGARAVQATYATNQFYGWFIVVPCERVSGFHFITMKNRVHNGESDDWHTQTYRHWREDKQLQKFSTGMPQFDDLFLLNTDQPAVMRELLAPNTQQFLIYLASTTRNSFAVSIQRSKIYMMIGHSSPTFRRCPDGKFTDVIHPVLLEDVKWYVDVVRGLSRIKRA